MKRQPRILAGTALGLLMASAPLGAFPLSGRRDTDFSQRAKNAPLILAQAECAEGETAEACAQRQQSASSRRPQRKNLPPRLSPKQRPNRSLSPQRLNRHRSQSRRRT